MELDTLDKSILMELQYRFPRDPYPYETVAERLGIREEELLDRLRRLKSIGILKRVGFYVNYRSVGLKAALIAYKAPGLHERLAKIYRVDRYATHVYLRDHPEYNVWVVTKRRSMEELIGHVEHVKKELGVEAIILYSKRTYKLSVKYDLERGISWAGPYSTVSPDPPRPEDLGIPAEVLRMFRSLPIERSPYSRIAEALGVGVDEAAETAWNLLEKGLLGDPGAALDGRRVGFNENAMVVMEPSGCEESLCQCATQLPFTTHVVLRRSIPEGAWRHTCYFMVHAVSREMIKELVGEAVEKCSPRSFHVIRSLADLKPGVMR
ncbi:MAG: Lrp/AsnC family transcriptional regulator [Desulfurococcales archaeon]|nr:Lrp/AsnC family transcriptional regulator [Desulfurococcales archaeon]